MAQVVYLGPSHVRGFSGYDFEMLGVEGQEDKEFPRGQIVEVSDEVAQVLITDPRVVGEFGTVTVEVPKTSSEESAPDESSDALLEEDTAKKSERAPRQRG